MPELPEVETVVRTLGPRIEGRRILSAEFRSDLILRHCSACLSDVLPGRTVARVQRRGKHIVCTLDAGLLIVHLGMTGKLLVDAEVSRHTRAIFTLEGATLLYDDIRMFGSIEWCEALPARFARLGPEPFDVSEEEFFRGLRGRRASIKALLLNQTLVRGLGNIYVDEALFRAGVRPEAPAYKLSRARSNRVYTGMLEVLSEAIAHRGSSISDYVDAEGRQGGFQDRHNVYSRGGEPCRVCGTPIRRLVLAQRGTHYCPKCQR